MDCSAPYAGTRMTVDATTKGLAAVTLGVEGGWAETICFQCVSNDVTLT